MSMQSIDLYVIYLFKYKQTFIYFNIQAELKDYDNVGYSSISSW